jgi:hypothetical protein
MSWYGDGMVTVRYGVFVLCVALRGALDSVQQELADVNCLGLASKQTLLVLFFYKYGCYDG